MKDRTKRERRIWMGRLALALGAPLLAIGLLELACRTLAIGYPTRFLQPALIRGETVWTGNPFFGYRFFEPLMARTPAPLQMARPKEPEVIRVVVLGESAAMGDPAIEFGLARVLDKMLNAPGAPRRFEVVNAAMTAINSAVVRDIAHELTREEADILIIYMGNNEVVGPYGPGTVFTDGRWGTRVSSLRVRLTRLRLAGVFRSAQRHVASRQNRPEVWRGMEMFAAHGMPATDPRLKPMYRQFARNLEQIIRAGQRHGAQIVVCTVAVNVRDSAPFGSQLALPLEPDARRAWERHFLEGKEAQHAHDLAGARAAYESALAIDAGYAELVYRYARVLDAFGAADEALPHYTRARDLDTQRFRADTKLNRIIRDTAQREGVVLIDVEQRFGDAPGADLFLDHVHFTMAGVTRAARAVFGALTPWHELPESPDEEVLLDRLFYTPWSERKQAALMLQRRQRDPFATQWGNSKQVRRMQQWADDATARIAATSLDTVESQYTRLSRDYPADIDYAFQWGQKLAVVGAWDRAADVLGEALSEWPGHLAVHNVAALAYGQSGQPEAAAHLLLETGPPYGYYLMDTIFVLADTLERSGRRDLAEDVVRIILDGAEHFPGRERLERWLAGVGR